MRSCPEPAELARATDLPGSNPVRAHLRDCPRCRAAVRSMEAFERETTDQAIPQRDVDDATRRLQQFIDAEVLGDEGLPPRTRPRARAPIRSTGWMAAAAVVLLALGIWKIGPILEHSVREAGTEMRGEFAAGPFAPTVSTTPDGMPAVSWNPVDGADDYVVILWNEALEELIRLEPSPTTSVSVGQDAAWLSVVARQNGREIARSELIRLP